MANLGAIRRAEFGRVQGGHHLLGMNAADRHKKLVSDYLTYYARDGAAPTASDSRAVRTDVDALVDKHRFIRSDADDVDAGWEARLAKRYYDRLFKEYAIVDLSLFRQSRLGMRWRTQQEVLRGKGQFACGAKGCEAGEGLCSYEVNFAYDEAGARKQALVKLRVCPACACKLNYRREKQLQKAVDAAAARKRKREQEEREQEEGQDPLVRQALQYVQLYAEGGAEAAERGAAAAAEAQGGGGGFSAAELERAARDVVAPPGAAAAGGGGGGGGDGGSAAPAVILLPADNSVWEAKAPQESSTVEDEMDSYFEGLFL